jgi:nucleoside-diphosphate-sugar epimerase
MILVTGGTGLVGSHLLYKLAERGNHIRAIYRTEKKLALVKHVFSYYTSKPEEIYSRIEWVKADLNDIPGLTEAFKNIIYVYHCAAFVSFEPDKYHLLRRTNIEGTGNIVNLCLSHEVKKLCYVSSVAAIGHGDVDTKEITEVTEWNSEADNNVYAITKYGAEMEVWRASQEGLSVVIVNPGVILGPGFWRYGSGSLIRFIGKGLKYYTTGTTGYVDIHDVIKAMLNLMDSGISDERYILVAENLSFKDFSTNVAKELQVAPPDKEASRWLLQIAWRMDWINHKLRGKRRKLSRQMASNLSKMNYYSSEKIRKDLDFSFRAIDQSLLETCRFFVNDLALDSNRV